MERAALTKAGVLRDMEKERAAEQETLILEQETRQWKASGRPVAKMEIDIQNKWGDMLKYIP